MRYWIDLAKGRKCLLLILFCAAILRLVQLDSLPGGLNQDEASAGYDAYALLTEGIDRNGYAFPVHFVAWGSGQNALYSYVAMPFIALFDLSAFSFRLPAAILGSLSVLAIYWMVLRFRSELGALLAAFFVAISPWHLMMSRWALEANIFPTIVLAAFASLFWSDVKRNAWIGYAILLAVSLYAYGSAYLFVPIVAIGILLFVLINRSAPVKVLCWSHLIMLVLAAPMILFIVINLYELNPIVSSFGSIPRYTGANRFAEISVLSAVDKLSQMAGNLGVAKKILLEDFHDGNFYNSVPGYGYLYNFSLPFIFIGLAVVVVEWVRNPKSLPNFAILLWLVAALAVCASVSVNFNRMNIIFYPLIIFAAVGVEVLFKSSASRVAGVVVIAMFVVGSASFCRYYFVDYKRQIGASFFESLDDAIKLADEVVPDGEIIAVTSRVNMPYIAVLFHTKYDVKEYVATRRIDHPDVMFQWVSSFGRYVFADSDVGKIHASAVVFDNIEANRFDENNFIVRRFKNYGVAFSRQRFQEMGREVVALK